MNIGDFAKVSYSTGEKFRGEVVNIREMPENRVLFTIRDAIGYRSMYLDKCTAFEVLELQTLDS